MGVGLYDLDSLGNAWWPVHDFTPGLPILLQEVRRN